MISCLLVDDHPVMRAGCRRLLELSGFAVIGEAEDAEAGYAAFCREAPEVTISDVSLPGASGFELVRRIRARQRGARVLVFSMLDPAAAMSAARTAGASGFVAKDSAPEVLLDALRAVARGGVWWPDAGGDGNGDWRSRELSGLSTREIEVLRLLASGCSPEACAAQLHLARKTVANYQSLLRDKLGIDNGAELAHFALRHGLLGVASATAGADISLR